MAAPDYDFIAVGGGAAGLTAAGLAASLGAKTLLVERDRLGGDCTWTGCVPSKALLASARVAHAVRRAASFGLGAPVPEVRFADVMARVHRIREAIYEDADAPERLASFGVETLHGAARFVAEDALAVHTTDGGTRHLTFRRAVICTGSRPAVPPIEGLEETGYLTNHTLFEGTERPASLAVIGAGPIGCEMGQAFARLGTRVTVVEQADRILPRDDPDHARRLQAALEAEGIRFVLGATLRRAHRGNDATVLEGEAGGRPLAVHAEAVLVAAGRRPNVEGLGLVEARVAFSPRGIRTDARGRTSNPRIYAAGDVTGAFQLTHMSEHTARTAVLHALLRLPVRIDRDGLAWTTFTDPELGAVGRTEAQLRAAGTRYEVYRFPYERLDRALTEDATVGEVKVFASPGRGRILGASVLGARAGELIALLAVARKGGLTLRQIADTIIPYPTWGLGARRAADQWYARRQFPWAVKAVQRAFGYRGEVPPPPDPDRIV